MTNEIPRQTAISHSPSHSEDDMHDYADLIAEQRRQREWLKNRIDGEHIRIERSIHAKIINKQSRIKAIRQDVNSLKFLSEANELLCFVKQLDAERYSDGYDAYVAEAVYKLHRQLIKLRTCVASSNPCKQLGCPKCSPSQRAQAVAEAAVYLADALKQRKYSRLFSVTVTTDAWLLPLYKADDFMRENMSHTIRTLFGNLPDCSDILMSIEGSLSKELAVPIAGARGRAPAKGTLTYRMNQAVFWHLHGVLVADQKEVTASSLQQTIEHIIRRNVFYAKNVDVKVQRMKVHGLKHKPEQLSPGKWLRYITKMLTADEFSAADRRAFRYATNDLYTSGLLSTGPILFRCRDLSHAENYLRIKRAQKDELLSLVENADSETLARLVKDKLSEMESMS